MERMGTCDGFVYMGRACFSVTQSNIETTEAPIPTPLSIAAFEQCEEYFKQCPSVQHQGIKKASRISNS
jgi:hypothetical protein